MHQQQLRFVHLVDNRVPTVKHRTTQGAGWRGGQTKSWKREWKRRNNVADEIHDPLYQCPSTASIGLTCPAFQPMQRIKKALLKNQFPASNNHSSNCANPCSQLTRGDSSEA